ncbi:MAG: PIN domain-containing protein [Ignavibacteriae bacterium]|nr:PIN domain-containing protein [Ignavibacteriota bacterium]
MVDTSVYGGVFDEEFSNPSQKFFEQVKNGDFLIITSALVREEMSYAPEKVRKLFEEMRKYSVIADITEDSLKLRESYINANIVTSKYSNDALHVAIASSSNCSIILSWNFKHIVHYEKIALYNAINLINGYQQIFIYSPNEVINYD